MAAIEHHDELLIGKVVTVELLFGEAGYENHKIDRYSYQGIVLGIDQYGLLVDVGFSSVRLYDSWKELTRPLEHYFPWQHICRIVKCR